jgi:hypothetical protein
MRFHPFRRGSHTSSPHDRATTTAAPSPPRSDGEVLADEAEAFVNGTLAELRAPELRSLAPWMILNRLAHADADGLRRLARGQVPPTAFAGTPRGFDQMWTITQRSLAVRVLAAGRDPEAIRRVQHDVLIPLELGLITRSKVEVYSLVGVVNETIATLDRYRLEH